MTFEDLRKSWQSEVARPASAADLEKLLGKVRQDFGSLERKIHWRDLREILAAMFVVVAFAAGWPIYRSFPVACLGVAVITLSTPIIVYILLAARTPTAEPLAVSVLEFSRQRLAWLDRQIRLLQTIVWWYVAPLFTGCTLVAWGLTPGRRIHFVGLMFTNVLVAVVTIFLNRRAVRNELMPMRHELMTLVESLEPTSDN
ncbi:MAG TPA: hypothetical protein VHY91_13245 [Pirellulales bacterium]|jgi:hypothetical protein|nr:hypothetical protein [Pirellulales bacterium]